MTFSFGYVPNPKGHLRVAFSASPRFAQTETPSEVDLEPFTPPVYNQGDTSSCTGHGTSTGMYTTYKANGAELPFIPSMRGIYLNGLSLARASVHDDLQDVGCSPALIKLGIDEYGIRKMGALAQDGRFSDCDPRTLLREVALDELEEESLTLSFGDYMIPSADVSGLDATVAALRLVLASKCAVGSGSFVDTAFMNWSSDAPKDACDTSDPRGGLHWMCFTGYKTLPNGKTAFKKRNSWGDWCLQGNIWVSEDYIRSEMDLTAYSPLRRP